jgi:hypothetical protein
MNNKILSVVLLVWIATTGFAWLSSASHNKSSGHKSEMREVIKKHRSSDMSREEKQARMQEKRLEMQARRAEHRAVVEKLLAWESLSASEEATRLEMLAKMQDDILPRRYHGDIIEKILAWDELSEEELSEVEAMKDKREIRQQKGMKRMQR